MFWNSIAEIVAWNRGIREWLIHQAQKRPYADIGDYMGRWWLVPETWWFPWAARIHHIKIRDSDRAIHDHPCDWRTIILWGWYVEEDAFGKRRMFSAGHTNARQASEFHRISEVSAGGVWTLFIYRNRTKNRNRWGYMVNGDGYPTKVHHKDYDQWERDHA